MDVSYFISFFFVLIIMVPLVILYITPMLNKHINALWYRTPSPQEAISAIVELSKTHGVETETQSVIHSLEDLGYVPRWQAERLTLALYTAKTKEEALRNLNRIELHVSPLNVTEARRLRVGFYFKRKAPLSENIHYLAEIKRQEVSHNENKP